MRVIATAGHVDHGKSTLVTALTGTDPDRWPEEHARGLTLDLGFAWTRLGSGLELAFVDVPGHEKFIANMPAGVGPTPAVMFVVAADEGWRRQSQEHLDAIAALGIDRGLLVVTRSDLADPSYALDQARAHLTGSPLASCPAVAVSARTGQGLDDLRLALDDLCHRLDAPDPAADPRLWIDRAFTIRGAGTVVTGTLSSGALRVGDTADAAGHRVMIRGLRCLGEPRDTVSAPARVALNLRGVVVGEVGRGHALTRGWHHTSVVDALVNPEVELPEHAMAHVGTAAHQVRIRPLASGVVRLAWPSDLPLRAGDRLVLRDPGQQRVLCGAVVADADPPTLTRRGDAARWGGQLAVRQPVADASWELNRRGHTTVAHLRSLGADPATLPADAMRHRDLAISADQWQRWLVALTTAVTEFSHQNQLQARMPIPAAARALGLPDQRVLVRLAQAAGLAVEGGHVSLPGATVSLGDAEPGLAALEVRLRQTPFAAPERDELAAAGLGTAQVATAVRLGRLIDLGDQIVLLPSAPALAMRELANLPQPFTLSQARQCLHTTRRVAVPLLEQLDHRGWTRRLDGTLREVVRPSDPPQD